MQVGIVSLGCAKNLVDTEIMLGLLRDAGYQLTNKEDEADVLIVNTCGFITAAKEESIETILQLAKFKQQGKCRVLLVTGCLAQRYPEELLMELPEIDGVIGTGQFTAVVRAIEQALVGERIRAIDSPHYLYDHLTPRLLSTPKHMAYLKIADGCDNHCAYCAIPTIRGKYRSRTIESILEEARSLAEKGVKEIILIAQDTTRYGIDLYGSYRLAELLPLLGAIEGIEWIRLLYCYPSYFTPELIKVIENEPKVCKYLDIPLQHADDKILMSMNRKSSRKEVESLITYLKKSITNLTLRTSFIVGLPGETEESFHTLLRFMEEMEFDRVGIFKYSPEEGTLAATMEGQLEEEIKEKRYHQAMELQRSISKKASKRWIDRVVPVLVEKIVPDVPDMIIGRTERDAPEIDGVIYVSGSRAAVGDIILAKIVAVEDYDLIGEAWHEPCK